MLASLILILPLEVIQAIKEKVQVPLLSLEEALKSAKDASGKIKIREASIAVYNFLESIHVASHFFLPWIPCSNK